MHIASPATGEPCSARPLFSSFEGGPRIGFHGPFWYILRRDAAGVLHDELLERPSPNRIPLRWSRQVHAHVVAGAFGTRSAAALRMHIETPAKGERSSARPLITIFEGSPLPGIDCLWWYLLRRHAAGVLLDELIGCLAKPDSP